MARADEPRVTVRFSRVEFARISAAAAAADVAVGALVREAALRSAAAVARDVSDGEVTMRRRSTAVRPVRSSGASFPPRP